MELDGFLHLLYGALEVAFRLREGLVGPGVGRVGEEHAREVVFISLFHGLERLLVVLVAVEVDVVARVECLPVARHGSVLLRAARCERQQCYEKKAVADMCSFCSQSV